MSFEFAVIGAGAWGTAIANVLSRLDKGRVIIWAKEKEVVDQINQENKNDMFLKGVNLEKNIYATENLFDALGSYIFYVTPAQSFRNIIRQQKNYINKNNQIIICAKGIEISSGYLLSEILNNELPYINYSILSGPSFAHEVGNNKPAALVLASNRIKNAINLSNIISSKNFRLYPSDDVVGVQLGGAIKNVYAISSGIVKGLSYGENAGAALLTRAISEMVRISISLGGKKESIFGLSGVGDILLTCTSELSRNFSLGKAIGQGSELKNIISNKNTIAEGYFTTKAIYNLVKSKNIDAPILNSIYNILYNNANPNDEAESLLNRPLKNKEFY